MAPTKIAAALVKAQKDFAPALKGSLNPHYKSRYADLSRCVEAVIDALNNNGIMLTQTTRVCDGMQGVIVSTMFIHESGESMDCGELFIPSTKPDAQGYGSALTYARRYSLLAACGIAPEDDDGNEASKPQQAKALYENAKHDLSTNMKDQYISSLQIATSIPTLQATFAIAWEYSKKAKDTDFTAQIKSSYANRKQELAE